MLGDAQLRPLLTVVLMCAFYVASCLSPRGQDCSLLLLFSRHCLRVGVSVPKREKPVLANPPLAEHMSMILCFPGEIFIVWVKIVQNTLESLHKFGMFVQK